MNFSKTKNNSYYQNYEAVKLREDVDLACERLQEDDVFGVINTSPLSHLLAMIGSLPEIRQEKVFNARDNVRDDIYEMDSALDMAIDKVLEELLNDE